MSKSNLQDTLSSNGINILHSSIDMKFFMFTDFERRSGKDRHPDIDGIIKLKDENENYLELYLHYQTKSHTRVGDLTRYSIKKKDVMFLTKTNVPTVFFIVDVERRKSYWIFLNKNIDSSKGITIDISKNEIEFSNSHEINLAWRKIAISDNYSETKGKIVKISSKFELNIQSCLGILYLFRVINKQEFLEVFSTFLNISEHESKTIIGYLESENVISTTANYHLLENERLGTESLFELLNNPQFDFNHIVTSLNADSRKVVFEQLSKIKHHKVDQYFKRLSKEFINYFSQYTNNDDIFINLELLERYAFRTPTQAIQILKKIINTRKPLKMLTKTIEGWGEVDGKTHDDLLIKSVGLLEILRYLKPKDVLPLLIKLSNSKEERIKKKAYETIERMAKFDLHIMNLIGYQPQLILLNEIEKFGDKKLFKNFDVVVKILGKLVEPSFEGVEVADYNTISFQHGALPMDKTLGEIRERAFVLLKNLFSFAKTNPQKKIILQILGKATRTPFDTYSKELEGVTINNTNLIIDFYIEIVKENNYEITKTIEEQLYRISKRFPEKLRNADKLQSIISQNTEYDMFKIFVGYDYRFDEDLDWEDAEKERKQKIQEFIEQISDNNFKIWQNKILLIVDGYNQAEEHGEYQYFYFFFNELGRQKPDIAVKLIQNNEKILEEFLIHLIAGIWLSKKKGIAKKYIDDFINKEKHLPLCTYIFSYVKEIDERLLIKAFEKSKKEKDVDALNNIIRVITDNYPNENKYTKLFIDTIKELTKLENYWWKNSVWYKRKSILEIFSENDFDVILENLLLVPNISYQDESILEIIGKKYPIKVIKFFENRVSVRKKKSGDDTYDAIPHEFYKTKLGLQQQSKIIIPEILKWYKKNDWLFTFEGGNFLKNTYPINELDDELVKLINTGNKGSIKIVLSIFGTFQGRLTLDSRAVRTLVRKYPKYNNRLMSDMSMTGGVVIGEYGFVNSLKSKKESLKKWRKDKRKYIQKFILEYEDYLDKQIDYQMKREDEEVALRKHRY